MEVPMKKRRKVEEVLSKVQGLSNWARLGERCGEQRSITLCGDGPASLIKRFAQPWTDPTSIELSSFRVVQSRSAA